MAGTKIGGLKAAKTNKERDPNFYARIGAIGGRNGHSGGFSANGRVGKDGLTGPERARIAGAKGGAKSKRGKTKTPHVTDEEVEEVEEVKDNQ